MEDDKEILDYKTNNNKLSEIKTSLNTHEKEDNKINELNAKNQNNQIQESKKEKNINNINLNKKKNNYNNSNFNKFNLNNKSNINNNFINYYSKDIQRKQSNYININRKYYNPFYQSSIYYKKNPNTFEFFYYNPYYYNKNYFQSSYNDTFKNINNISSEIINNSDDDEKIVRVSLDLVKSKSGCDILINKSLNNPFFANELLFPKLKNNLKEICCNICSSYLMKCLLEILTYEHIDSFISCIKDNLFDICLTEPGSRVIEKLIEKINEFPLLLNKFNFNLNSHQIGNLINSKYGNYIFKKYLSSVKIEKYSNFIYEYIFKNFNEITKEKYGICVVMKALSEANENRRKKIFEYILNNFEMVIKNCYGNYLIKHIFLHMKIENFEEILPIIKKIEENIVDYCKSPYSSSVIEKCFELGEPKISEHMIEYLLENHLNSLIDIIDNSFGFYIIIKALKINNKQLKEKILRNIINNIGKIKISNNMNKIVYNLSVEDRELFDILRKKNHFI